MQAAFEAAQRHLLSWAKARHPGIERLVLSGGCALNVTANGRVLQSGLFGEIIAPPAPHDAGCAIGAALAHLAARGLRRPGERGEPLSRAGATRTTRSPRPSPPPAYRRRGG